LHEIGDNTGCMVCTCEQLNTSVKATKETQRSMNSVQNQFIHWLENGKY